MDNSTIILVMIGIVSFLVLLVAFQKQITYILKFIFRGVFGIIGYYLLNFVLGFVGMQLGVNFISFIVVGFLGFWGFLSLIIIQIII